MMKLFYILAITLLLNGVSSKPGKFEDDDDDEETPVVPKLPAAPIAPIAPILDNNVASAAGASAATDNSQAAAVKVEVPSSKALEVAVAAAASPLLFSPLEMAASVDIPSLTADPALLQQVASTSADAAISPTLNALASDFDVQASTALKRSPSLEDNSIADPLVEDAKLDAGKAQEKRQAPAVAAIAAEKIPAAAEVPKAEVEEKRESRGAIELSGKSKRIVFGTAMTANKIRRKFPLVFCELERDNGIVCPGIRRGNFMDQFHYDPEINRCQHFVYNGCGGNANRFSSLWECNMSCAKKSVATVKVI